jgi:hypothetical protein
MDGWCIAGTTFCEIAVIAVIAVIGNLCNLEKAEENCYPNLPDDSIF